MIRIRCMMAMGMGVAVFWTGAARAGEVRLAEKGQANCVIVAPAGWTNDVQTPPAPPGSGVRSRTHLAGEINPYAKSDAYARVMVEG